ncbi:hypothetical protein ACHAPA_003731 [Fusarium lateritium]
MASPADEDETKAVFFVNYPTPDLVSELMDHSTFRYAGELIRPAVVKGFLQYQVIKEGKAPAGTLIIKYKPDSQVRGWALLLENGKQKGLAFSAVKYLPLHEVVDIVCWCKKAIKAHIPYDVPR